MKIIKLLLFTLFFLNLNYSQTKVACVGNSITFGATIENREKFSYPMQLQSYLGSKYIVKNFGHSGATLLKKGNVPYTETEEYKNALSLTPDIVFIELGTNDSKPINRALLGNFENDYMELINTFQKLASKPRVILLLPPPVFFDPDTMAISNKIVSDSIIPMIREIAYKNNVEVINLYNLFLESADLVPDKVHPSSVGATLIAERCYEVIKLNKEANFDIIKNLNITGTKSSYHGFECFDFMYENNPCKIAKPKFTSKGKPWIWRARFWGHEPQTDIALLERGFHLVYCDVAELFGNQIAVDRWNRFYAFLQKGGLSKKTALEGFSRGGLYVYSWALQNAEKVACIYADAPVLDIRSWPGKFFPVGGSSPETWEACKTAFGFKSDEEAKASKVCPIDRVEEIAKLKIPLIHVCGLADETVPYIYNTKPFAEKILEFGGSIKVIEKPGIGHHPHSLKNPQPIVDFILAATGYKTNFAVIPMYKTEYRSANSGWTGKSNWLDVFEDINECCKSDSPIDLLIIGNSITQAIGGERKLLLKKPGKEVFDGIFKGLKYVPAGIAGDGVQHALWRIINGSYGKQDPKNIVLSIGINNFNSNSPSEIVKGIEECVKAINKKMPKSNIILFGPLPCGKKPKDFFRTQYIKVHDLLAKISFPKNVKYLNSLSSFTNKENEITEDVSTDGVHFTEKGYKIWGEIIKENMKK